MTRISLLLLTLAALPGAPHGPRWRAIGPGQGAIGRLAFAGAPSSGVWASTPEAGIQRSGDGGVSWRAAAAGLATSRNVTAMAPAGADGRTLVVAAYEDGLFRTTDAGASWNRANDGLPVIPGLRWPALAALAADGGAPDVLYAGGAYGVFRSADRGATWTATALPVDWVHALAAPPGANGIVYAWTDESQLAARRAFFRSTDAGGSWARAALPDGEPLGLVAHPRSPETLYALSDRGLFRTTDGAASWRAIGTGLPAAAYPEYRFVRSLVVDPFAPDTLHAAVNGSGVYRSTDAGLSFSAMPAPDATLVLAADASRAGRLLAGTAAQGVFESTDGGAGWTPRSAGLHSATVNVAAAGPRPGELFAVANGAGLFRSTDGGSGWSALAGVPACAPAGLHVAGGAVFAGCGGIVRSTDAGATFAAVFDASGGRVERFASLPGAASIRAAGESAAAGPEGDTEALLFSSDDGGTTWAERPLPFHVGALAASPAAPGLLLAGARSYWRTTPLGLYRSTDGGATFAKTSFPDVPVTALGVDPASGAELAGTDDGLFLSTDAGETWARHGALLQGRTVTSLAFDRTGALLVGTSEGVFRAGAADEPLDVSGDLGATRVLSLVVDGPRVLAGTVGGGLFAMDDGRPSRTAPGGAPGSPVRR